ncbi:MAG TPA: helix-turn-helix transcriptional regulator [Ktedonobacteraceae bacterium]|nr:helix-turn-helix transcriptional regulator [Ktedonobacteraceae bacterium]
MTQVTPVTSYREQFNLRERIASFGQYAAASSCTEAYHIQQTEPGQVARNIEPFMDSTNDCGALLNWRIPGLRPVARTSDVDLMVILSQLTYPESLLTNISSEQIIGTFSHRSTPHLEALRWIKVVTGLSQMRIGQLLNVTRQTIINWEHGTPINDGHRRRLFAVRDVIERAARHYTTPAELVAWLDTPRGTDGRTPAELLEMNKIDRARLLAVSSPSSKLVRPPAWVNRQVSEAFRAGGERRQETLPPEPDDEMTDAEAATYELIEDEEGAAPDEQSGR